MADDIKVYEVHTHSQGTHWKLTQAAWFQIFLTGKIDGEAIQWIQPAGDESKRVTFEENLPHGESQLP